ncbi:MAG TPA: Gfo/Idh/MocA family oxidoreductase [Polyangiaceae bacterium]
MAKAKLRIGIVGTGGMAHSHAEHFKRMRGVTLASCLDVVPGRAEAFAQKYGIERVASQWSQLLPEVDAVALVTPDAAHSDGALTVLRAGKHLLCEKPLTVTLAEARRVAAAGKRAAARGQIGMVNFSYRRSAALQRAILLARSGQLGELRHAHGFYLQSWVAAPIWGHWSGEGWLWRMSTPSGSGGVLGDVGCHLLDLMTSVIGEATAVRCELGTFPKVGQDGKRYTKWRGRPLDANDTALIELRFRDGGLGVLHLTRWATGHANHLRLEVHGTEGAVMFDLDRSEETLDTCLGKHTSTATWKTQKLKPAPTIYQRFVRAVQSGEADQPDLQRGAEIQAYLTACERSAQSGTWQKVPSV